MPKLGSFSNPKFQIPQEEVLQKGVEAENLGFKCNPTPFSRGCTSLLSGESLSKPDGSGYRGSKRNKIEVLPEVVLR
jgi:hypothetical protein